MSAITGLRLRARDLGGPGEGGDVLQTLDMKADRGDALILGQRFEHPRHVDVGLVADGEDGGHRQGAARHGEVAGDVAGLRDDGDAALDGLEADVRPATKRPAPWR